uniref:RING-type domain-containing protein n=1 Tax=Scophthalmus maximus TaxID=52904 RepID=A0A8D3AJA5_SCOMX
MALNYQTSTLSMTLPISCQICLGKVRQPVICANHHVFCSSCMEMWLKKASQCPSCRVPITSESPCREIIGGTNESDHSDSPSTRKCLRKTRGELLLREYEGEVDGLIRENGELKAKNQSLEAQLKTALDPCSISAVPTGDKSVDPGVLEEWTNRLRAATDVRDKVKQDMDKLKEANKALRSQNVDLVQENMRLKAEVASRSPQKFGRYTVAALEAKIQQYERDVDHLKRALERSDQYIEDLESRVRKSETRGAEVPEACASSAAGSDALTQQQKINMMMRSLSDNERALICSNPETESRTISRNHSLSFVPSADHKESNKNVTAEKTSEDLDSSSSSDLLPATPSSAFRSLTLKSPGIREKRVAFKPASYLRRLDFEDFPGFGKSNGTTENQFTGIDKFPKGLSPSTDMEASKSVFWGDWQRSNSTDETCPSPSKESSVDESTSTVLVGAEPDGFLTPSEASMDAAYLDKISELDSMMLDGESSSSRGSQLSLASSTATDLDNTLVPAPQTCPRVLSSHGGDDDDDDQRSHSPCGDADGTGNEKAAAKAPAEEGFAALPSCEENRARVSDCADDGELSQTEELSFDLLFDALEDDKAAASGSISPAGRDDDHANRSFSSCNGKPVNATRDRHALVISQPTKRKSHSPFSTSSPTKLSKLM